MTVLDNRHEGPCMNIDERWKRRIRIEGQHDETRGYMMAVRDVETGEAINNITRIVVTFEVGAINEAVITYYPVNEQGAIISSDVQTITVNEPEMSVDVNEIEEDVNHD